MNKQLPLGGFEVVSFPELGISKVIAKIDTGAYTGALHATGMQEITDTKGVKALHFTPYGCKNAQVIDTYRKKQVRSSNGELEERYVISTTIIIGGKERKMSISLSDRSKMMKSVLIGRQFLRRYHYVVDVRLGAEHRYSNKEEV